MTLAEATARLERMTASTVDPTLTDDEITDLLTAAARVDTDGLAPTDDDWTGTWDLNFAAAEGWRWKAGKVAERFAANLDGANLARQQIFEHCLAMATNYSRRVVGTFTIAGDDTAAVLAN